MNDTIYGSATRLPCRACVTTFVYNSSSPAVFYALQVVSELLAGPTTSPYSTAETALLGKADRLTLLADVGKALALGSEAEEELVEISGGALAIQVGADPPHKQVICL